MRQRWIATSALALTGLLVAACGSTGSSSPTTTSIASASFPLTVQSGDGAVHIAARPKRILSLSASATQMLAVLGAMKQVVGVDEYSTYPANAPRTKFTGYETSAEDYLPLKPDLVILAFNTGTLVKQLKTLHIPVLLLPPATNLAGVDSQIAELATATGNTTAVGQVDSALSTDLTNSARSAGGKAKGDSYYIEVDPTLYSATSKTFIGAIFSLFGMRNVADATSSSAYPQLSAEYIVKTNPSYVFLADTVCCGQNTSTFAKRPGFKTLAAVQNNRVIGVNDSLASEWGPHSLEALASIIANAIKEPVHSSAPVAPAAPVASGASGSS